MVKLLMIIRFKHFYKWRGLLIYHRDTGAGSGGRAGAVLEGPGSSTTGHHQSVLEQDTEL